MNTELHFSSKSDNWETPKELFDRLNKEFDFYLDVCADPLNAKTNVFYSKEIDGLKQRWSGTCWMNPPYGRDIGRWLKKAHEESKKGAIVVCLLPSRTDTRWWRDYVMEANEIRLITGRIKFNGSKNSAPFPSAIVIFNRVYKHNRPSVVCWDYRR